MRFLILVTVLFGLTACAKNVEPNIKIAKGDALEFAQNTKAFRFRDFGYPAGTKFELVNTEDGRQAVWIVPFEQYLDRYNFGFILDNKSCTTDRMLRSQAGVAGKRYEIYSGAVSKIPEGICFKRV